LPHPQFFVVKNFHFVVWQNMISKVLKSIFGSRNDRLLKQYRTTVLSINKLEADIAKLSDDELRQKTESFA
jgi:preprotein translocase subunit SecA